MNHSSQVTISTSIAPWLSVRESAQAVEFYKAAFGAVEVYRFSEDGVSVVSRLSVEGAEFWLSDESPENSNFSPETVGGSTTRHILIVADPDAYCRRAIAAGAQEIYPVTVGHGWKVGRVVDPYGHHWEIGHEVGE